MADNPRMPPAQPIQQPEPVQKVIPLTGGAYSARSVIANAQRCVNLYPEVNPQADQAPVPVTHYLTPGLVLRTTVAPPSPSVRGLYTTTKGAVFMVVGASVYFVSPSFVATLIGTISSSTGIVSMADNGLIVVLVDGGISTGWTWDMSGAGFAAIVDPNFLGGNNVAFLDGFFIFALSFTQVFYLSPIYWDGIAPFDPTQIASKSGGADPIISIEVVRRELWLIGSLTSEVWYNSGAQDFPFERQPGVFVEHGSAAINSSASADVAIFFLGADRQGRGVVFTLKDYQALRISTHAIEKDFQAYSTISDAIGFTYQQDGHTFYFLTFPTANKTWVYDMATEQWHERTWTNPADSSENRHRANQITAGYQKIIVGDWQNGRIYTFELDAYTDNGDAITRRRGFPHFVNGLKRVSYACFIADMEVGGGVPGSFLNVRWSDTRGATWGTPVAVDMRFGQADQYYRSLSIRRLGMARDRVFEVFWTFASKTALQGASIEIEASET